MNPPNPTPPPNGGSEDPKGPNGPSAKESARIIALLEAHANALMQFREQVSAAEKTHASLATIEREVEAQGKRIGHLEMFNLGPRVTDLERGAPLKKKVREAGHTVSRKGVIVGICLIFVIAAAVFTNSIRRESAAYDLDSARIAALEVHLQELNQRQDIVVRDFHRLLDAFVAQRTQP